jgi:hypothetical protein
MYVLAVDWGFEILAYVYRQVLFKFLESAGGKCKETQ